MAGDKRKSNDGGNQDRKAPIRRAIHVAEASGRDISNPYQLTRIMYKELTNYRPELKKYSLYDVASKRAVADLFLDANIDWLEDKILPKEFRRIEDYVQAYYKPYAYKKLGFNWRATDNTNDFKIWQSRMRNLAMDPELSAMIAKAKEDNVSKM